MNSARTALILGIVANALGGASYLGQKIALTGFPPGILLILRTAVAMPLLFLLAPKGWTRATRRSDWWRMAGIGIFGLGAPHLIGVHGLQHTESLNGALLIGLEPVSIVVLSAIFLRERISGGQILGMICAVSGAFLVVSQGNISQLGIDPTTRGNLLLALAALLWAIYTVLGKPTLERVPATAISGVTSVFSLLLLLPAAILELPALNTEAAWAPKPILAVIGLGLGVSVLATVMWNRSLRDIRASQMATLVFLQPLAGTLIGVISGEPLPAVTVAGGVLVFLGIYFTHRVQVHSDDGRKL